MFFSLQPSHIFNTYFGEHHFLLTTTPYDSFLLKFIEQGEKMKRFKLSCLCFVSLFFLNVLFPGCSNQEGRESATAVSSKSTPVYGGNYRIPLKENPVTLDPAYVRDIVGQSVVHQVFDGLVRFDNYLSILPALAETWEVTEKGTVYKFKIKDNAVFHNKEPVISEDVLFSIKRLLRVEPPSAMLPHLLKIDGANEYRTNIRETLSGIIIENKKNFSIHLLEPHAPFLAALGMYQASIVPEKAVKILGEAFGKNPLGSGPFQLTSWEDKASIRLKRFENYHAGPAYLDEILFRIYPGGQNQAVLNDFRAKRLEEMTAHGDEKKNFSELEDLQWFQRPSLSLFFYGINIRHPRLTDPDLRKTLFNSVDRTELVNTLTGGQYQVTKTILPPGMPGYQPHSPTADNKEIILAQNLQDTQNPQNLDLEIASGSKTPWDEKEIAIIQRFWARLGITVRPKYITDWNEFQSYLKSDDVQIYRYGWHADMPDPDSFLSSLFLSDAAHNFMNLRDENIDTMLSTARRISDPIKRAGMYRKIETDILAVTPLIPLFHMNVSRVYQPYVQSINVSALGHHTMKLNQIWLDQ